MLMLAKLGIALYYVAITAIISVLIVMCGIDTILPWFALQCVGAALFIIIVLRR